jgi:hypothetical protein
MEVLAQALGSKGSTPGGSTTQLQFNDAGAFAGDADLTWNSTTNVLGVTGDVNLSDGGTYTTTLQTITPTAARTISLPDATGTVALVAGSSGQLVYNNAGAYAGVSTMTFSGNNVTLAGRLINSYTSVADSPAKVFTGTWFTGGTATTNKPHLLIEPTGTTSTAWSTSGTGIGVNAASGFTGRLLDLQTNGTSRAVVTGAGNVGIGTSSPTQKFVVSNNGAVGLEITPNSYDSAPGLLGYNRTTLAYAPLTLDGAYHGFWISGTEKARIDSSGRLLVGTVTGNYKLTVSENLTTGSSDKIFITQTGNRVQVKRDFSTSADTVLVSIDCGAAGNATQGAWEINAFGTGVKTGVSDDRQHYQKWYVTRNPAGTFTITSAFSSGTASMFTLAATGNLLEVKNTFSVVSSGCLLADVTGFQGHRETTAETNWMANLSMP